MKVVILGGPHDGYRTTIPDDIGEGQMFLVDAIEYFYHRPKDKSGRLIYYTSSWEA
jgi:hypothetical protein